METNELKMGDVVQFKSGGPLMTVIGPNAGAEWGTKLPGMCACGWFHDHEYRTELLPVEGLKLVQQCPTI